ncbi:MAG: DUF3240 family protein [Rhodanobacter sp.]
MDKYSFSLVCASDIAEKLLDTLLLNFAEEVFFSLPTFSHGTTGSMLNPLEQVLGRSRSVYVHILLTKTESESLQQLLHANFSGTGIRYWASPISLEGELA